MEKKEKRVAERVEKEASRKRKFECQKEEGQMLQKTVWARPEEHWGKKELAKGKIRRQSMSLPFWPQFDQFIFFYLAFMKYYEFSARKQ